jgi:hypothetical protein
LLFAAKQALAGVLIPLEVDCTSLGSFLEGSVAANSQLGAFNQVVDPPLPVSQLGSALLTSSQLKPGLLTWTHCLVYYRE